MTKKLKLDKKLVRTLTPNEVAAVAGGTYSEPGWDPTTDFGNTYAGGGTGGWLCFTFQVSLQICPGTVNNTCGGGTTTGDPGCTTGGGETSTCMDCGIA